MKLPTTEELRLRAKLPEGYQFERFDRVEIAPPDREHQAVASRYFGRSKQWLLA